MPGTEAMPSGIDACSAVNIPVKPERMDDPLLVVNERVCSGNGYESDFVNAYDRQVLCV